MSLLSLGAATVREVFEPAFLSPVRSNQPYRVVFDAFERDRTACLLVTHPSTGKLQGVYTARDVLRKLAEHPIPGDADAQVHDYMRTNPVALTLDDLFIDVGKLMVGKGFRHVPLIQPGDPPYDDNGIPVGLARLEIWMKVAFDALGEADREALSKVGQAEIVTNPMVTADEGDSVKSALDRMLTRKTPVGAVAVTRGGALVGVLSEQDLTLEVARRMIVDLEDRWDDPIKHYASKEVFWLPESATALDILDLMMDRRLARVPIAREGENGLEAVKMVSTRRLLPQILKIMEPGFSPPGR
ncbi:MAG: CBS domain-containing protein [Myxococcota bacterium]